MHFHIEFSQFFVVITKCRNGRWSSEGQQQAWACSHSLGYGPHSVMYLMTTLGENTFPVHPPGCTFRVMISNMAFSILLLLSLYFLLILTTVLLNYLFATLSQDIWDLWGGPCPFFFLHPRLLVVNQTASITLNWTTVQNSASNFRSLIKMWLLRIR